MKKIRNIIIVVLIIILFVSLIMGMIFNKDITYYFACKDYNNKQYTNALNKFLNLDDNIKIEFIETNISGDNNFTLQLLDTIKNLEYNEHKISICSKLIQKRDLEYSYYEKIYNMAIKLDENYLYEDTKEIIYIYAKEKINYYDFYEKSVLNYENIINNTLMPISDYKDVSKIISNCTEKIANIYISFAENYGTKTLYADSINYYNKAIYMLEQQNNIDYNEKIQKCKNEITEIEILSQNFKWCEAYGCAREKAKGELHYCNIHLQDPTATTNVHIEKKENTSGYSYYHKCEYSGCNNYASCTQYCSKHKNK